RRYAYAEACLATWRLEAESDLVELIREVEALPPAGAVPSMRAQADRFAGLIAARRGNVDAAAERFRSAAKRFRELEYPFELAQVISEHAGALLEGGRAREAEPLLAAAEASFARLRAKPWLERVAAMREHAATASSPAAG